MRRSEDVGSAEALSRAIEEYLRETEAGRKPDRSAFLARHPELAEELAPCLTALSFLDDPDEADRGDAGARLDDGDVRGRTLGDFRLLRAVGRGGMGVVYEAEQVSLGRRVALKMLPFAAVLDERHLRRFRNEAKAAAHLHHTHIVPVHAVGCERGVHYYAMQFIDGIGVDDLIGELRYATGRAASRPPSSSASSAAALEAVTSGSDPGSAAYCRAVARLGVQAAEALDHAHEMGVIHRDVKPANLLVDAGGHLWITDFGLASFRDQPGPTVTGDLVGTVRYMSPEQALAKRVAVDHRTDIYSLGVTLYEMLTLEVAFPGDDVHRVIHDIAFRDPTPARRVNPGVAPELETILVTAMSKSPGDRYETARDLAEDLERFLEDRPIRARRPGPLKRAAKWSRRHRTIVRAAMAVLLLATVGLAVGIALVAQERAEAIEARDEARVSRERTETYYLRTVQAIEEMLAQVGAERLAYVPQMESVRRDLLEKAVQLYASIAAERSDDHKLRFWAANARLRLGGLYELLRLGERADAEFDGAHRDYAELAEAFDCAECRLGSLNALTKMAMRHGEAGRLAEAETELRRALAGLEYAPTSDLEKRAVDEERGIVLHALGGVLCDRGRLAEARETLERAVRLRERPPEADTPEAFGLNHLLALAQSHTALGAVHVAAGRYGPAERHHRRAVAVLDAPNAESSESPFVRQVLGRCLRMLASALLHLGRMEEAASLAERAVAIHRKLADEHRGTPDHRLDLAAAVLELGNVHRWCRSETDAESMAATAESVEILEELAREYPGHPGDASARGNALWKLGQQRHGAGDAEEAARLLTCAVESLRIATAGRPRSLPVRRQLRHVLWSLGAAWRDLGRPDKVVEAWEELLEDLDDLESEFREDPAIWQDRVEGETVRGQFLSDENRREEADRAYVRAIELGRRLLAEEGSPVHRRKLALVLHNRARLLVIVNKRQEALADAREALELRERLVREAGEVTVHQRHLVASLHQLADLHRMEGDRRTALGHLQRALPILEGLATRFPENVRIRVDPVVILLYLAELYAGENEPAAQATIAKAEDLARRTLGEFPKVVQAQEGLARTLEARALAEQRAGKFARAAETNQEVIDIYQGLVDSHRDVHVFAKMLAAKHLQRGRCLWSVGRFDEALAEMEESVRLHESFLERGWSEWDNRLFLFAALGDLAGCRAFRRLAAHEPLLRMHELCGPLVDEFMRTPLTREMFWTAWSMGGGGLEQLGEIEKAEEMTRACIRLLEPDVEEPGVREMLVPVLRFLGNLLGGQPGGHAEALATSERALSLDPDDPEAQNAVAWFLAVHPDPSKRAHGRAAELAEVAARVCEARAKANPADPRVRWLANAAWHTVALTRVRSGDYSGAIEVLQGRIVVGYDPAEDWVVLALALAYRDEEGDRDKAREWLEKIRARRRTRESSGEVLAPHLVRLEEELAALLE